MRQIFSIRFFAAVGAVVGLSVVLWAIFQTRSAIEADGPATPTTELHRVDFVDQIYSSVDPTFTVVDGVASVDTRLVVDGNRSVTITAGTPGELHCPEWGQPIRCAIVADLLGEAVVWFAVVPMESDRTVRLPAVDTLDEGVATLVNGWQFEFAPILDRRCPNDDFTSYRELRDTLGDEFVSVYGIGSRRLVAVTCRQRVPFAPPPASVPSTSVDA